MKNLCLPSDLRDKIRQHCTNSYPLEACGLLIGREGCMVTDVVPSLNLAEQPQKNFEIDPTLIIRYQKKTRGRVEKILGHYHSHPDGRAKPSIHDQGRNYDSELLWMIVQVTGGLCRDMKAFGVEKESGRLGTIPLTICPESAGTT